MTTQELEHVNLVVREVRSRSPHSASLLGTVTPPPSQPLHPSIRPCRGPPPLLSLWHSVGHPNTANNPVSTEKAVLWQQIDISTSGGGPVRSASHSQWCWSRCSKSSQSIDSKVIIWRFTTFLEAGLNYENGSKITVCMREAVFNILSHLILFSVHMPHAVHTR